MNIKVCCNIKTQIWDAVTGKIVKDNPWRKNLVLDRGLDAMASGGANGAMAGFANMHKFAYIGSGTNPVRIDSGAITFTQAATTVTASGNFFTSAMVGGILKYGSGSGGVEYYITAFTSATQVTVDTSATVGATTGVVWQVQQSTLQTQIGSASGTYITSSGSCGTTYSATSYVLKRTFQFPQGPYNVNEIGYSHLSNGNLNGRLVLSSTDSVSNTQFYVVILSLTISILPVTPTAVVNVGTNIDTSGAAMVENWGGFTAVDTNGATTGIGVMDSNSGIQLGTLVFSSATYTQRSSLPSSSDNGGATGWVNVDVGPGQSVDWTKDTPRGTAKRTFNFSISTSGQTLYGMGMRLGAFWGGQGPCFDIKFTNPFTAPSGAFNPQTVFSMVCNRTLTN